MSLETCGTLTELVLRKLSMWQNKSWADCGTLVLACVLGLSGACSSQQEFERVEEFPEGMQIDSAKSAWSNKLQTTTISDRYPAGYDAVWAATKRVAHLFFLRSSMGNPLSESMKKMEALNFVTRIGWIDRRNIIRMLNGSKGGRMSFSSKW